MLYRLFLITYLLLFISCTKNSLELEKNTVTPPNSFFYFQKAKDKSIPLQERYKAINSAYELSKKNTNDTLLLKILQKKSVIHYLMKQYDSLQLFNTQLLHAAILKKNPFHIGKHYSLKGVYYKEVTGDQNSAFYYFNQSKNYFLQIGDNGQVGKALLNMALIQQNFSDFFGSKETITESLQYLIRAQKTKYIASAYSVLATNHRKLLNYEDAIKYYNKAIEITDSEKDRFVYLNNLSAIYIDHKKYKKAIQGFKTILNNSLANKCVKNKARAIDNMAYAKWLSTQTDVENEFQKALNIRLKNKDLRGQIASYTHLAEFFANKDSKAAKKWIDKALIVSKKSNNPKAELDALKLLIKLAPLNLSIKNRYIILQDSLYKQELTVKTQFAKIKYDDKLKQEEILKLKNQKAKQETETAKQKAHKTIFLSSGIIILLIGCFVIYFLKQRYKREKIQETYKTETRISKKVHDELANDIYNVMIQLEDENKPELLNKIEDIYSRTRDISRENSSIDTGQNYPEELSDMLSSYTPIDTMLIVKGFDHINWEKISREKKVTLYRVLQELMTNMKKHSQAKLVAITFSKSFKLIKINYSDNGRGITEKAINYRNGLYNAENRIKTIGGSFIFDSETENGFKAEIQIPN